MILIILILTLVGLICAVIIFIVDRFLPSEPLSLKKAEEISDILPGMNCGACGYTGCFAYAQALAEDKNIFFTNPCPTVLLNTKMIKDLEEILYIKINSKDIKKKAVVACTGDTRRIGNYQGIKSCRAAAMLLGGFKKCDMKVVSL